MFYYKWKAWYKLLPSSGLKKNICACFYHPHRTSIFLIWMWWSMHKKYCAPNITAVILKRNELTVYISLKEANWHVLQIAKTQFRYTIWFRISEKSITRYMFLHCGGAHITKSLSEQDIQKKLCARIFNLEILENYLHVYLWFLDMNTDKGI